MITKGHQSFICMTGFISLNARSDSLIWIALIIDQENTHNLGYFPRHLTLLSWKKWKVKQTSIICSGSVNVDFQHTWLLFVFWVAASKIKVTKKNKSLEPSSAYYSYLNKVGFWFRHPLSHLKKKYMNVSPHFGIHDPSCGVCLNTTYWYHTASKKKNIAFWRR